MTALVTIRKANTDCWSAISLFYMLYNAPEPDLDVRDYHDSQLKQILYSLGGSRKLARLGVGQARKRL